MPLFLIQAKMTTESFKGLLANPHDRSEAVRKTVEAHGGKLHNYYFALGEADIVVIAELPDTEAVMAWAWTVGSTGSASEFKTTPLVTASDAVKVMRSAAEKSAAYRPPAGE